MKSLCVVTKKSTNAVLQIPFPVVVGIRYAKGMLCGLSGIFMISSLRTLLLPMYAYHICIKPHQKKLLPWFGRNEFTSFQALWKLSTSLINEASSSKVRSVLNSCSKLQSNFIYHFSNLTLSSCWLLPHQRYNCIVCKEFVVVE